MKNNPFEAVLLDENFSEKERKHPIKDVYLDC